MGEQALVGKFLALLDANQRVSGARTTEELVELVFAAAADILQQDSVAFLLLDEAGRNLVLTAFQGEYRGVAPGLLLPVEGRGVTTWVAREGRRTVVPDVTKDERYVASGLERGSELAVPIQVAGRGIGVLDVQRTVTDGFTEEDGVLLQTLANYAGVALGELRAREALEAEKSRLETILDCSADAIIAADVHGRVTFFSRGAEELFGYRADQVLGTLVAGYYLDGEREARRVAAYVRDEGKVRNHETWFRTSTGERLPTSLSASVLRDRNGAVLGTLGVLKDITVEKRLERKLSYTIEMLQEANENLGRLAMTDSLSALKNQRFFRRKLDEELVRSVRSRRPVSLLLIDIDKFKRFNDSFGHQVGDRVIQVMGQVITASIRQIDHGCRYGGEEFTVILPETSAENALVVARRIQGGFSKADLWQEIGVEPPTLSIGLAERIEETVGTVGSDPFIKAADDAMYRAKRDGGDRVETG